MNPLSPAGADAPGRGKLEAVRSPQFIIQEKLPMPQCQAGAEVVAGYGFYLFILLLPNRHRSLGKVGVCSEMLCSEQAETTTY